MYNKSTANHSQKTVLFQPSNIPWSQSSEVETPENIRFTFSVVQGRSLVIDIQCFCLGRIFKCAFKIWIKITFDVAIFKHCHLSVADQ